MLQNLQQGKSRELSGKDFSFRGDRNKSWSVAKLLQFLNRGLIPPLPLLPKQVGLHQVKNHKAAQSTWAFEETICLKMQTGGNLIVATHSQWQPLILEESLAGKAQINLSASAFAAGQGFT